MIRLAAPRAMRPLLAGLLVAALSAAPAAPATLADLEKAEAALLAIWEELPLTFRNVMFVVDEPKGLGMYTPRASATFAPHDRLIVYAEAVGYLWDEAADGLNSFGLDVDFVVTAQDGRIVAADEDFFRHVYTSHAKNREFQLTLTLTLTGVPTGDYVLGYVVRDTASDKRGTIRLPFTVAD
jgi:hypothetical protein